MSSKPVLSIAPIGKGNYKPKLNETITDENLKNGVWEINTSKLLNEVRNEITEQEKETGYIESDFFPIKKQQNLTWANRTPNSKMASPVQLSSSNTKNYTLLIQSKNKSKNQSKNQSTNTKPNSRKNRKTRKSSRRMRRNKSQRNYRN